MPNPNKKWNLMIQASTRNGFFSKSLHLYSSMINSNVHGDSFTFPFIAKACGKLGSILDGMKIHAHTILLGFQSNAFVQTSLLDMYSKCSCFVDARKLFDEMPQRNLVSWNSMIHAYSVLSDMPKALGLFNEMRSVGIRPSASTLVSIVSMLALKQCTSSVHSYGIKVGFGSDLRFLNAVMSAYVRLGLFKNARLLFESIEERSIVTWTVMMGGYVKAGDFNQVFNLFKTMLREAIELDSVAFLGVISACVLLGNLFAVCMVHSLLIKKCGFDGGQTIIASSLVNAYAKSNDTISARRVFDSVPRKDVSLWTSMISGYVHVGCSGEALALSENLLTSSIKPNKATISTILSACTDFGSLSIGEKVEEYAKANNLILDLQVCTSLIQMYCKCGNIERAKEIFERVPCKDLALWSTMINGYACHGMGQEALSLFNKMQTENNGNIKPDAIIFTSVLLACDYCSMVNEGLKFFYSMRRDYGIEPSVEHYCCIVQLLGKNGDIDAAIEVVHEVPIEAQNQVWHCLLSVFRDHHENKLAEFASKGILDSKCKYSSEDYVLMANICASLGKWKEASELRGLVDKRRLFKEPGWSRIESRDCFK
ncbi:LOW QUALITY PROTEIN: pentatricopeptide repeat-containing protein At3g16610-like [Dioscorea cayenensis subsp. rotundata]|uniref:LOW QUALITY PROTEIN: pentatricopeptide repeat-containing protein At3g16610-like n=1 Tax=Dioscorea cayennensis subsp. rotundata TaxID=55577 RepID=A0AB40D256_DIOCR|nr:LOW QUALITY PROTEIN: pentatricopeptide repeat-containing protein At3g16610-like [Dioscorea cayenensis subsp. rotundata]